MRKKNENIVLAGEIAKMLDVTIWDVHRLEERGIIPRSKGIKKGKLVWRTWPRSALEKIKIEFSKFSDADRFLEKRKVNMDIQSNKQIVKFLGEVVISHSVIHSEERLSDVLVMFHLDKKEKPQSFEVVDVYHQE